MWEAAGWEGLGLGWAQLGARWRGPECQGEATSVRGTHGSELSAKGCHSTFIWNQMGKRWRRREDESRCEGDRARARRGRVSVGRVASAASFSPMIKHSFCF